VLTVLRMPAACALVAVAACGGSPARPARTAAARALATPTATATPTPTATPQATPARAASRYTFSSRRLGPALRRRLTGSSWHRGCPVPLSGLRYLRIAYRGFDRRAHVGEMVVAAAAVAPVRRAFRTLFAARFPIRRMRLVDDYGASDYASIEADNTSAFNCRDVTGGSGWSEHAFGRAIDIDPIENPYVYPGGKTTHRASRRYLNRSRHRRGMAFPGGVLVRAFTRVGWGWGGVWPPPTDYQHFSATGR
jgi:hypothetical protein